MNSNFFPNINAKAQTGSAAGSFKNAGDVAALVFYTDVGADAVEAGSTNKVIVATAHAARRGDRILITSGALSGYDTTVKSTTVNSIELIDGLPMPLTLAATDTFEIYRPGIPLVDNTGAILTSGGAASSDVNIHDAAGNNLTSQVNGAQRALDVGIDVAGVQVDPRDIRALAAVTDTVMANIQDAAGNPISLGSTTSGGSVPVVIATDQTPVFVKQSGTWTVQPGNTANSTPWLMTISRGGNSASVDSNGALSTNINDGNGNILTSQVNGAQQALDVGINVAGVQVDPRDIRALTNADVVKAQLQDDAGNGLTSTLIGGTKQSLDVNVTQSAAPSPATGRSSVEIVRNDYTSVNVTTAAYVQLVASTAGMINLLDIFDSSGQTLVLAFGAAASEVDQFNIYPGGNGKVPITIPAATRISIKAVSATASTGEIDINCFS